MFLLLCLTGSKLGAQPVNDSVFRPAALQHIRLVDAVQGKNNTVRSLSFSAPLLLFVFLSPECPLCQNYTPALNALQQQYAQTVQLAGIVPGRSYNAATIRAFAKKYKINYPLLQDPQKKLTAYLRASITPEVILLDNRGELVYRGALDNRLKQLGVQRWKVTENYLADAIAQYLQHIAVAVKRVQPTGCLINDF